MASTQYRGGELFRQKQMENLLKNSECEDLSEVSIELTPKRPNTKGKRKASGDSNSNAKFVKKTKKAKDHGMAS